MRRATIRGVEAQSKAGPDMTQFYCPACGESVTEIEIDTLLPGDMPEPIKCESCETSFVVTVGYAEVEAQP
jgi:transcription elongation factor Elf1